MAELREYTQDEYTAELKMLLADKGLYEAVKVYADEIADEVRGDGYIKFSTVTEWLVAILDLIKLDKEEN